MNSKHLDTLLAVLDQGSFEGAADRLGITPSAVSQRIKTLEAEAGRVLVRRTTPVTVTEAGAVLAQTARRMALLQAETDALMRGRIARVPLNVAINADSLATWFRPVLASVAEWDSASLHLRVEDESRSLSLLRSGDCIGAVTRESKAVSGCEAQPLGQVRYVAVASPTLRDRYTKDGQLDWAAMPALRYGPNDKLQDEDLHGRVDSMPRHRRISQIPSSEGFLEAARVGLGWALVPQLQAHHLLDSGELVLLDDRVSSVPLYWQHWRLESPLLEQLSDAVVSTARAALND